jgi:dTDP-4-dehydrorhamnose 3,5-epimerase
MQVVDKKLNGLVVIQNKKYADDRGFFEEFSHEGRFAESVDPRHFVQVNHSRSKPGVVRGLHYQTEPAQGKLVGVIRGRIWDVAVDIRKDSKTRGQHFALELSEDNGLMLWVPQGFAHGFIVTGEDSADVLYLVDQFYNPKTEGGIVWNDPALNIPWPREIDPIVSERDQNQTPWQEFVKITPAPF